MCVDMRIDMCINTGVDMQRENCLDADELKMATYATIALSLDHLRHIPVCDPSFPPSWSSKKKRRGGPPLAVIRVASRSEFFIVPADLDRLADRFLARLAEVRRLVVDIFQQEVRVFVRRVDAAPRR